MARRQSSSEGGVSLFPFMSILACLIGILTLLISVTMQVKNMDRKEGQTEEERALAEGVLEAKIETSKMETLALLNSLNEQTQFVHAAETIVVDTDQRADEVL